MARTPELKSSTRLAIGGRSKLRANKNGILVRAKKITGLNLCPLTYHVIRKPNTNAAGVNKLSLNENNLVTTYANIYSGCSFNKRPTSLITGNTFTVRPALTPTAAVAKEKRGYIKHMVRLRYRWHFRHELGQFKLFRKFFKRSLKRYRKIQKNRLFIAKFRKNFSKLTGFNEEFLYTKWVKFRRNYNQYWSISNAVLRFSQSLLLAPYGFLVIAKIAPSLAASKYLVNSGAVSINGAVATAFSSSVPGDILQINLAAFQGLRALFSYQQWAGFSAEAGVLPFMHADWSSMLFMLVRWPRSYELIAPSFLSERWVRYYIRSFPSKSAKFKKISYNTKIYRQKITKK